MGDDPIIHLKNMTEVKNDQVASAGQQVVNSPEATAGVDTKIQEVLNQIPTILEENNKLREERDNYKEGMLSAKAKIKEFKSNGYVPEDDEDTVNKIAEQVISKITPLIKTTPAENSAVSGLMRTVDELKAAIQNRQQVGSATTGSGEDPTTVDRFFTKEQIESLKARGLDPEKVKQNMLKK